MAECGVGGELILYISRELNARQREKIAKFARDAVGANSTVIQKGLQAGWAVVDREARACLLSQEICAFHGERRKTEAVYLRRYVVGRKSAVETLRKVRGGGCRRESLARGMSEILFGSRKCRCGRGIWGGQCQWGRERRCVTGGIERLFGVYHDDWHICRAWLRDALRGRGVMVGKYKWTGGAGNVSGRRGTAWNQGSWGWRDLVVFKRLVGFSLFWTNRSRLVGRRGGVGPRYGLSERGAPFVAPRPAPLFACAPFPFFACFAVLPAWIC